MGLYNYLVIGASFDEILDYTFMGSSKSIFYYFYRIGIFNDSLVKYCNNLLNNNINSETILKNNIIVQNMVLPRQINSAQ